MKNVDYLNGNIEQWDASDFPRGKILVHNRVRPAQKLGTRGFWFWLADPDPDQYVPCRCGWASHLRNDYRVRRVIAQPPPDGVKTTPAPSPKKTNRNKPHESNAFIESPDPRRAVALRRPLATAILLPKSQGAARSHVITLRCDCARAARPQSYGGGA